MRAAVWRDEPSVGPVPGSVSRVEASIKGTFRQQNSFVLIDLFGFGPSSVMCRKLRLLLLFLLFMRSYSQNISSGTDNLTNTNTYFEPNEYSKQYNSSDFDNLPETIGDSYVDTADTAKNENFLNSTDPFSTNDTDHQRFKRARQRIHHILPPSEVDSVEHLLRIEPLKTRNLGNYIGYLDDDSAENAKKGLEFLAKYDIIANEKQCPNCNGLMSLQKDTSAIHDQYRWICPDCRNLKIVKKFSPRKDSFFDGLRLTIQQVLFLAAEWIESPHKAVRDVADSFEIDKNTVSEVHEWFRDLTQQWWIRTIEESGGAKLGGKGKVVEIDETAMFKAKYHRGAMLNRPTIWVFGLLERGTNKIAMFQVPKRDANTLLPIIQQHVLPGTTITSDGWAAYNSISSLKEAYRHNVINHKLNFIDPVNNRIHTQGIEASWKALKVNLKTRYGDRDYLLQGHLYNYVFRRFNNKDRLLNRLIIEMKYYDRDHNSLLPPGFEELTPEDDTESGLSDNIDSEDSESDGFDDNSGDDDLDDNNGDDDLDDNNDDNNLDNYNRGDGYGDDDEDDEEELKEIYRNGKHHNGDGSDEFDDDDVNDDFNYNERREVFDDAETESNKGSSKEDQSSSSSADSSGSEFIPRSMRFHKHPRKNSKPLRSPKPSTSGLRGTNNNLRFSSDETSEENMSPPTRISKKRIPTAKIESKKSKETHKKKSTHRASSPVKVPILFGKSMATTRRTDRGRGRKEGMMFSTRIRQQLYDKNNRQRGGHPERGRGSRGGRIGDRLAKQREEMRNLRNLPKVEEEEINQEIAAEEHRTATARSRGRSSPVALRTRQRGRKRKN